MSTKDFLTEDGAYPDPTHLTAGADGNPPMVVPAGRSHRSIFQRAAAIPPALLTAGVLAIATLLRIALTPVFGSGYTFITFYPATMFSTVIAGWRYGLATALAAAILSTLLFIDPFSNVEHAAAIGVFLAVDGLMIVIADWTRRARRQSELEASLIRAREGELREEFRKRTEVAARTSGEQLRSILDRAPATIFLKDRAGRYLFFNDQFGHLFHLGREHAYGKTDRELLPTELADQFVENDRHVWESGTLLTIEEYVPQMDGRHTSLVQKFLLRDADGHPYALCGIALDITDRLKMEAAIRAGEERLQLAQTAGGVGTFDWDIVAQRGVWSPELERIWGLPPGSFEGSYAAWRRLVYPEDLAAAEAGAARSMEDPSKAQEYEYRIMRPDGALRWIYAKAKTLCDAEGRRIRMVGVNMDITDRKEAQLRLERSTEELEREVEVRTKELVQSQNRLRAMATELNLTEQRERKRLATELHDHLQQMLVFGKLTIGQGKQAAIGIPACEKVLNKVDEMLSDALSYTRTLVSELSPPVLRDHGLIAGLKWLGESMKKHELSVAVIVPEDNGLKLPEDQEILLFQSVRELLINSSKHAGVGHATVRLVQYDDCLEITVRDEGKGFDLTAAGTPGSGLSSKFGLFSIRERMRALGGSFAIDSAPGHGTTATIMLRVTRHAETAVLNPAALEVQDRAFGIQLSTHQKSTATRVLLVDDHAMVRQGLRSVLDAYKDLQVVGEARDGEEAVKLVQDLRPRVVVMDINMPKMNGIDATARIKAKWPGTIVIGISVNTGDDNSDAMKRAGATTVLTKDKAVDQLHDAIIHEVGASTFNLT
ncbi:MAG: response regulator [Nitrospira sp.]|jgi:PAS domain S-box-containing protein|nr:response regulator [Nitrospira sp. BO4]